MINCCRSQSYKYDIYQKKTYPQPCRKYACCHGFTMVKDICYGALDIRLQLHIKRRNCHLKFMTH